MHGEHLTRHCHGWTDDMTRQRGLGAGMSLSAGASRWPPLSPQEGWLSNGRLVPRFRPSRWERDYHLLEVASRELLPGEPVPLLKSRREISLDEALKLWAAKRLEGWRPCEAQW